MMKPARADDRMCLLTDSLPSAIRWRLCDYEALLRAELRILATQEYRSLRHGQRDGAADRMLTGN